MGYFQQIRFEGGYSRGNNDMDVSSLEAWEAVLAQASPQEVAAFYEGIQAGANGEDLLFCTPCEYQDEPRQRQGQPERRILRRWFFWSPTRCSTRARPS